MPDHLIDNDKALHCGACGVNQRWGLCRPCIERWSVDGIIPPWLSFLRTNVNKEKKRLYRQAKLTESEVLYEQQINRVNIISLDEMSERGADFTNDKRPARKVYSTYHEQDEKR